MGDACSCCGKFTIARKLFVLLILCAIVCLLLDVTTAAKPTKKNPRKKGRNKRRKFKAALSIATSDNSVTLPNELERPVKTPPKSLDPSATVPKKTIPKKSKKSPRPHIIFVIADDLGYNDVGYHAKGTGCVAYTPTINALALTGVRLENYYVQPICTPTRASILTGRYPIRMGLQHGNLQPIDPNCLPLNETTLPRKLQELGYNTHAIGKWHLGFSSPACLPTRRGFDSFLGIVMGTASHYTHNNHQAKALYYNESAEWGYIGQHSSEMYTDHAIDIIKHHDRSVPLFMYLSYQAVHGPLDAPDKYLSYYKNRFPGLWKAIKKMQGPKGRLQYLGLLQTIDVGVKRVTDAMKRRGLWDNTVLVFTSDNGGRYVFSGSNWPLRGEKNTLWEGGIKGVAFVNSPLLPESVVGTIQNGLMHVSDWFPTLIEGVAGGVAQGRVKLDGINMWPTITKGYKSPRWEILHNIDYLNRNGRKFRKKNPTPKSHDKWRTSKYLPFDPHIQAAIRYDDWKLITGYQNAKYSAWVPPLETLRGPTPMSTLDDQGIYVRLYDVSKDPEEKKNVALAKRHIVYKLLHRLKYYNDDVIYPKYLYNDPNGVPYTNHTGEPLVWKPWLL